MSLNQKLHMLQMADSVIVRQAVPCQFIVALQDINEIAKQEEPFLGVADFIIF